MAFGSFFLFDFPIQQELPTVAVWCRIVGVKSATETLVIQARRQEMKWGGVIRKRTFPPQNETKLNQTLLCNLRL